MAETQLPPESSEVGQAPPQQDVPSGNQEYVFPNQPEPEYLLLEWLADSRIAHKRSKEYYSSLAVIVLLLSLILFFANQVLLIFVLISFLFVTYVLASVKPDTVHNAITSYGIHYRGKLYFWEQLGSFWITDHHGKGQVHVQAPAFLASQIVILPSSPASPISVTLEDLVDLISRYLPYEEPNPTQIDRWVQMLEEKFPLDTLSKSGVRDVQAQQEPQQEPSPPVAPPPVQSPPQPTSPPVQSTDSVPSTPLQSEPGR